MGHHDDEFSNGSESLDLGDSDELGLVLGHLLSDQGNHLFVSVSISGLVNLDLSKLGVLDGLVLELVDSINESLDHLFLVVGKSVERTNDLNQLVLLLLVIHVQVQFRSPFGESLHEFFVSSFRSMRSTRSLGSTRSMRSARSMRSMRSARSAMSMRSARSMRSSSSLTSMTSMMMSKISPDKSSSSRDFSNRGNSLFGGDFYSSSSLNMCGGDSLSGSSGNFSFRLNDSFKSLLVGSVWSVVSTMSTVSTHVGKSTESTSNNQEETQKDKDAF